MHLAIINFFYALGISLVPALAIAMIIKLILRISR